MDTGASPFERTNMTRSIAIVLCVLSLFLSACTGDKPKELLETAEFEERQHNETHAKQLYEDLVRLYPSSKEADTAKTRLSQLNTRP
jgi:TolA-binding protein